jgi:hypothetical protein
MVAGSGFLTNSFDKPAEEVAFLFNKSYETLTGTI